MIIIWNNHAIAILLVYVISRLYGSNHPDILLWLLGDSHEWSQNFIFITDDFSGFCSLIDYNDDVVAIVIL